jgi:hypothetical protein
MWVDVNDIKMELVHINKDGESKIGYIRNIGGLNFTNNTVYVDVYETDNPRGKYEIYEYIYIEELKDKYDVPVEVDINQCISNIIVNTKIIHGRYQACINNSVNTFEQAEKNFIEKLIVEIDKNLQKYMETHKEIDFHKDIKGHYYDVISLVRYDEWPEFEKYVSYIDGAYYDRGLKIVKFMRKSFQKYGFPTQNIFDFYDNGCLRYKLMDFNPKGGGSSIGENYEDYS